jgi:GNAT superfamily N-acetyltransferase
VSSSITLRHTILPGDIGRVVAAHGLIYARERQWNVEFEAYVAEGLGRFVTAGDPARNRLWLAERGETLLGSIAIARHDDTAAQLRWFLVDPAARGAGLGRRLIGEALEFCRATGVRRVFLWTVAGLDAAARHYQHAGFTLEESLPGVRWGAALTEQRHALVL